VQALMDSLRKPRPNDSIDSFNAEMDELAEKLQRADDLYDVFANESLNYNLSLAKTLRDARNEMSGFNVALEEAEQDLQNLQQGLTQDQQQENNFLAMGVSAEDVARLTEVRSQVEAINQQREAAVQAEQDAAREAERVAQNKQRVEEQFANKLKDTRTQLRLQLGLISDIDAQIQEQRELGIGEVQLAQLRELLEAQAELSATQGELNKPTQFAGVAQKGSAEAFKIIANAGRREVLEKLANKQLTALQQIAQNTKPQDADGVLVQGAV